MLKLDIGCGAAPRPGFIGVDFVGAPEVRCDIAADPLPFPDRGADYIYSSHCLEHIAHDRLIHVFREITRVAANGASVEIWHPHLFHEDAFVLDHITRLGEALYAGLHKYWAASLGARWLIQEVRYRVEPHVLQDVAAQGINLDFAVCHLHDIVKEIGIFIQIYRGSAPASTRYKRSLCDPREVISLHLEDGPRVGPLPHR